MLNKVKKGSNMYGWINATWNPIKGKCPHDCKYCYYQNNPYFKPKIGKLRLDEKCLKDNLGENNFIFVGSSCDMFADEVPKEWIEKVLEHCKKYPGNNYLFQTKNPNRFLEFESLFPKNTILGTTLETNYINNYLSNAPLTTARASAMVGLPKKFKRMITLEPLVEFNLIPFVEMIREIKPEWVNIGADSKGSKLREPSKVEIETLIKELEKFTEVKKKDNLKRLMK